MLLIGDWAPNNKKAILICDAEIMIGNLEGPVLPRIHSLNKIPKAGPSLFTSELPSQNKQFIFSLANNHIMDYGLPGLESTIELLDQKKFKSCGAGKNIHDAKQPIVVEENGAQVGLIACCEAQFGVARQNQAGVAEFGPWIYHAVRALRETVDAVIVSVHAGVEESPWPSPYIREFYQSLIDAGATVVHGHHAHVPQGYETYGDGLIFYGMGNFAIDPDKWCDYPNGMWSLAVEINFSAKPVRWHPLTFEIRHQPGSDTIAIEESNSKEQSSHLQYLQICNRPFDNAELFDSLWQEAALRAYYHHGAEYMRFSAPSKNGRLTLLKAGLSMLKRGLHSSDFPTACPSQYDYLLWYHMIACESHRQMLATALGVLAGEVKDLRTEETRLLADEMMPLPRRIIQA